MTARAICQRPCNHDRTGHPQRRNSGAGQREVFARGREYFQRGAASNLIRHGAELSADVLGSEFAPYDVKIQFHDGGVAHASCSCPYDEERYDLGRLMAEAALMSELTPEDRDDLAETLREAGAHEEELQITENRARSGERRAIRLARQVQFSARSLASRLCRRHWPVGPHLDGYLHSIRMHAVDGGLSRSSALGGRTLA